MRQRAEEDAVFFCPLFMCSSPTGVVRHMLEQNRRKGSPEGLPFTNVFSNFLFVVILHLAGLVSGAGKYALPCCIRKGLQVCREEIAFTCWNCLVNSDDREKW